MRILEIDKENRLATLGFENCNYRVTTTVITLKALESLYYDIGNHLQELYLLEQEEKDGITKQPEE